MKNGIANVHSTPLVLKTKLLGKHVLLLPSSCLFCSDGLSCFQFCLQIKDGNFPLVCSLILRLTGMLFCEFISDS